MTEDTLVGISDLAMLLDVPKRTLGEWRRPLGDGTRREILPDSELDVDKRGTLIWRLSHVLAHLAEHGRYDGPIPEQMPLPDLVSLDYIEAATGAKRRAIHDWTRTLTKNGEVVRDQTLPDPAFRVSGTPLWLRETIDGWVEARKAVTA